MDIQPNLQENSSRYPESVLKRCIAQPLNGSAIIALSSGASSQTRVEIPACVQRPDLIEIGYQMALNASNGTPAAFNSNSNQYFLPATYLPEWDKIEISHADSTVKLCEITNFPKYSKMTSSLFNDFKKRNLSQRVNFKRDNGSLAIARDLNVPPICHYMSGTTNITLPSQGVIGSNVPVGQQQTTVIAVTDASPMYSDAYLNETTCATTATLLTVPTGSDNQQEYIPMGFIQPVNNAAGGATTYQPYTYSFNFRLGDVIHDSFLNNMKHHYHSSNLVITIYWSPVSQILAQVLFSAAVPANSNIFTAGSISKNGTFAPSNLPNPVSLCIMNLYVRYYAEKNEDIVRSIRNAEYEIIYPTIQQANLALQAGLNGQIASNLMLGNEGDNRLYRIYTSLFGTVTAAGRFLGDNCSNIGYDVKDGQNNHSAYYGKWAGNHELWLDSEMYDRLTSQYGDWYQTMSCFEDGSLNTKSELEYLGTIAYHFDSSYENGKKYEYARNILKGKIMDKQININPRFLQVQTDGGDNPNGNYVCYIFAVVMKKGYIRKGVFSTV